jgi:hypothetical protein
MLPVTITVVKSKIINLILHNYAYLKMGRAFLMMTV